MKLFKKPEGQTIGEDTLPLIAIRDMVLFPHTAAPIYIQKPAALASVEKAMASRRMVLLAYFSGNESELTLENLNAIATKARIVQVMKLPNNSSRVLLEGVQRVTLSAIENNEGHYVGSADELKVDNSLGEETATRMKALQEAFRQLVKESKKIPKEVQQAIDRADNPNMLADQICGQLSLSFPVRLDLLNMRETNARLDKLSVELESELQVMNLKKDISKRVKQRMDDTHREYVINEQIKELNKELGKDEDDPSGLAELERRFGQMHLPEEVRGKADSELKRLKRLQPMSPEAGILRSYLEWIADLPWDRFSEDRIDIEQAQVILDEDHYDMDEPKERILDFLSVLQMKQGLKGPILCFVGPPGTGKTSLGKSLARAMGREFVRISLGGVRDEAEIRGHRRTYVGALPGKIIQGLKKAGTSNPVFLLDEIDKLGRDHRGDPSAALLEVLDPEQNKTFADHYLEVSIDLSRVLFVTTANSLEDIPYPLLDRMEVIQIPGYTRLEKSKIAQGFIIPKQIAEHGLDWADIRISTEAIKTIIDHYTRESGVRSLEREIAKVMRKIARKAVADGKIPGPTQGQEVDGEAMGNIEYPKFSFVLNNSMVGKFLGPEKFDSDLLYKETPPGLVYGMAWTQIGGKLLPIEAIVLNPSGNGEMTLTGSLGDVMKESARIALSVARHILEDRADSPESVLAQKANIHIHVPAGAIPKDGPSAGITLTCALLSLFRGQAIRDFTAMTGEITLTGRVLPVGGIKEKVLAAHRNGFKLIILPEQNRKDHEKLPQEVKRAIRFEFVEHISQVAESVLATED